MTSVERSPLIAIVGPTAIGKTAAAVELALRLDGEVVNADSRYLYRGLDIGTAKPDAAERRGVPHHLIDILDPAEPMSLATWQDLASTAIADIHARGRLPLLVGGTPQYVAAAVEGWRIPRVPPNPPLRLELEREAAANGVETLRRRLQAVDPVAAAKIGPNTRRIIRALEVHAATGLPISTLQGKGPPPYAALEIWLTMPRDALYARIDARVDEQLARGLLDEVRSLLAVGVPPDALSMSSLGYRQSLPAIAGTATVGEVAARIKTDTHRYVRQQETWLRRNPRLVRIDVTAPGWRDEIEGRIRAFVGERRGDV
ncbi:MAG: tRNA (adenosine(37)-N6)-dimethylallyltransferase MiaA [Chloroflexia bacterium]|nr:tRNA (adenosine(37)-N6)-dimethylallyltransferase MiaA [Chloroflexia bacterium]